MPLRGQYEYVMNKNHQRANPAGAVYTHMLVAEQKLGRSLLPEEVVHHRDLNKLNNDPDNIMVFASNSDHLRFHAYELDESILSINSNGAYVCEEQKHYCIDCGVEITYKGTRCKECYAMCRRKVDRPSIEELFNMLNSNNGNFTRVAKHYGVSDNAIRKWCKSYKLPSKSKDYQ